MYSGDEYYDDDITSGEDEVDGCLHGVPWSEECPECDENEGDQ